MFIGTEVEILMKDKMREMEREARIHEAYARQDQSRKPRLSFQSWIASLIQRWRQPPVRQSDALPKHT